MPGWGLSALSVAQGRCWLLLGLELEADAGSRHWMRGASPSLGLWSGPEGLIVLLTVTTAETLSPAALAPTYLKWKNDSTEKKHKETTFDLAELYQHSLCSHKLGGCDGLKAGISIMIILVSITKILLRKAKLPQPIGLKLLSNQGSFETGSPCLTLDIWSFQSTMSPTLIPMMRLWYL